MSTFRVSVVAADPATRSDLAGRVESLEDVHLVLAIGSFDEIHPLSLSTDIDTVLIALDPGTIGLAEVRQHRRRHPALGVIALTASQSDDECFAAIQAGAAAYVPMDIADPDLAVLIKRVAGGEYVINEQLHDKPQVAARVLAQFRSVTNEERATHSAFTPLTDREVEILRKISEGMSNREIGLALGVNAQTVKNHVASILRKLAVNDRTEAVIAALRRGWLSIDEKKPAGQPELAHEDDQILQLLKRGMSHAEIAGQVSKPVAEVSLAVRAIIRKLGFGETDDGQAGQHVPSRPPI
jgi:two-component system response regulator DegU